MIEEAIEETIMSHPVTQTAVRGRKPARILIVDDHALVRLGMTQLLEAQPDLECVAQADGMVDAVRKIQETRIDLAIVDLMLLDGSGLELIKMIHSIDASIKVLVLSMYDETVYAERCLDAGAKGFINKEEPPNRMVEAIRAVLEGQIYLSPKMTTILLSRSRGEAHVSPISLLSDRELEVFGMIGQGNSTREVAKRLHVSIKTIETHRERIKGKLGLENGTELILAAFRWNFEQGGLGPGKLKD
jgi:DNA-binding NarL/FixJ family response regulator